MDKVMTLLNNLPLMMGISAFVAACFGSFITLVSYRLPRGEPIVTTRSRCPKCGTTLRVRDLIPLVSYLINFGMCRHCGLRISVRYFLIELCCAGMAAGVLWLFGPNWQAAILIAFALCLIALIVTDLEHYLILDEYQIALLLLGCAYIYVVQQPWLDATIGFIIALVLGLVLRYGFLWLRNKDGLGMGDVKFFAVSGLWLGYKPLVPFLFYAGILGLVTAGVWRFVSPNERFPFGPALAMSLLVCVVFPDIPAAFWNVAQWLK